MVNQLSDEAIAVVRQISEKLESKIDGLRDDVQGLRVEFAEVRSLPTHNAEHIADLRTELAAAKAEIVTVKTHMAVLQAKAALFASGTGIVTGGAVAIVVRLIGG